MTSHPLMPRGKKPRKKARLESKGWQRDPKHLRGPSPALPSTKYFALIPAAKAARTCRHTDVIHVVIRTKTRVSGGALRDPCGVSGQAHVQPRWGPAQCVLLRGRRSPGFGKDSPGFESWLGHYRASRLQANDISQPPVPICKGGK